jgi:hypothetical protein
MRRSIALLQAPARNREFRVGLQSVAAKIHGREAEYLALLVQRLILRAANGEVR